VNAVADYKLKDFFDAQIVTAIAGDIAAVHPDFDNAAFSADALVGLDAL
jgi:hypothetical protein